MRPTNEIRALFDAHNSMLRTSDLLKAHVYYKDIQALLSDGTIGKVRYGYYQCIDSGHQSEAVAISCLFPDAIVCMDTALEYYKYSVKPSRNWHLAVSKDSGKSRFKANYPSVKPYYIEPALLGLGETTGEIDGKMIRIYDKERTICDCLRYAGKIDQELFDEALLMYTIDPAKDMSRMIHYAKKLRVEKRVKTLMGVWL